MMRSLPVVALTLALGLSVAGCDIQAGNGGDFKIDFASGKATDTWSRSYKMAATGRFELINVNGKITAESTDGTEVIVEGRRTAKGRSDEQAKELLAKLEIREEIGESTVRVESRPPRFNGGFSGHEIEWTIKVPKGVIVDLRTVNGGVRLNDLANEIHAKTTNGGVRADNITPSTIEASAVNGGIEFNLASPLDGTDSVDLETVNGGVTLELPSESKATLAVRCVNGGVHVDNLEIAREEQSTDFDKRRRLNGTMNGGGANVKMNTTNGGIHLSRSSGKKTS
jgi:DUF4097 and DUF4098 domain-containing protein YvlB